MSRRSLFISTLAVEGAIFLLAVLIVWFSGLQPAMSATLIDLALGVAVGLALSLSAVLLMRTRWSFLARLQHDFDLVIALFSKSSVFELALFSALAGIAEEMLFRGVLQSWLEALAGPVFAVVAAAALFGLVHAISKPYVVFASLLGLLLGVLYYYSGSLLAVMAAHAVYDFVALVYGTRVRDNSRRQSC